MNTLPDPATLESVRQTYRDSLMELTFNSKPIITNLTIIAQEALASNASSAVVRAIEDQARNAPVNQKVPAVYLMDSILKNVGGIYKTQFAQNLVSVFSPVYRAVNVDDKKRLEKVVMTWRTFPAGPIFPLELISQVESIYMPPNISMAKGNGQIPGLKPSQPISHPARPLHIPPPQKAPHSGVLPAVPNPLAIGPNGTATLQLQQQMVMLLQGKQQQLFLNPADQRLSSDIQTLEQLLTLVLTTTLDPPLIHNISNRISNMLSIHAAVGPAGFAQPTMHATQPNPLGFPFNVPPVPIPSSAPPTSLSNFSHLISSVGSKLPAGLHPFPAIGNRGPPTRNGPSIIPNVPPPSPLFALYDALGLQCKQCGLRFPELSKQKYSAHLDWHFRQNRRIKDRNKRGVSREWYLGEEEWVNEQGIDVSEATETKTVAALFGDNSQGQDKGAAGALPASSANARTVTQQTAQTSVTPESTPVGSRNNAQCATCCEVLEKCFDEDQDMWVFNGVVEHNDLLYHQSCYDAAPMTSTTLANLESNPTAKRKLEDFAGMNHNQETMVDALLPDKKVKVE